MVTLPLVTFRILNPTVGIMSSLYPPVAITFTREVFPAFCSPIKDSSISCLKKRLLSQFRKASQRPMAGTDARNRKREEREICKNPSLKSREISLRETLPF
nr:hypothetical protein Iba_chr02fCG7490 [Ipomoea batatas]